MSAGTEGVAWAMCLPNDARPIVFAVVGSTVYSRMMDAGWQSFDYGSNRTADFMAVAATRDLESVEDAILVAGPRGFDLGTRAGAIPIGWIVGLTLRLQDSEPSL